MTPGLGLLSLSIYFYEKKNPNLSKRGRSGYAGESSKLVESIKPGYLRSSVPRFDKVSLSILQKGADTSFQNGIYYSLACSIILRKAMGGEDSSKL